MTVYLIRLRIFFSFGSLDFSTETSDILTDENFFLDRQKLYWIRNQNF